MGRSDLVVADLQKPHWGNYQSNIDFMDKTGLFRRPRAVLEIGSGKGHVVDRLRDQGHSVVGVDIDRALVAESRVRHGDLSILVGAGERLPFSSSCFDVVLSFDVFEHIPDSDSHLAEVQRVLKPDGRYLFETPNKWTNMLFEPLRFTRKFGISNAFKFLEPPEHCSLHSWWDIKRRFDRHGLRVRFYDVPVVNDFFRDKVRRFLGRPGLIALKVFDPDKLPIPFRTNFFVEAWMA